MKQIIVLIAMIALGVFLGGIINGTTSTGMKTNAKGMNQGNGARYAEIVAW